MEKEQNHEIEEKINNKTEPPKDSESSENKNESKLLGQSRYRQKIAQAIFSALVNFKDKYENPLISDN